MRHWAVLFVVAASFAGCIGDGDDVSGADDEQVGATSGALPQVLSFGACSDHLGLFPIPTDDARGYVPEGFEPVPFPLDPLGIFSMYYVLGLSCVDAARGAEPIGDSTDISGGILVVPPAEYKVEGVELYAVLFGIMSSNQAAVDTWNAWGITSAIQASTSHMNILDADGLRAGTSSGDDGDFAITLITTGLGPATTAPEGAIRLFNIDENGTISGAMDVHWTEARYAEGVGAMVEIIGGLPPLPAFANAGLAAHAWGEEYALHFTPAALPEIVAESAADEMLPLPTGNLFGLKLT